MVKRSSLTISVLGLKLTIIQILGHLLLPVGQPESEIDANKALGVTSDQSASNIAVGRYTLSTADGSVADSSALNTGDNHLMGVGGSKTDTKFH